MTTTDYTGRSGWASRYGERALERNCDEIRSAGKGERAVTLFKKAVPISRLVAGGELDGEFAYNELFDAGRATGLPSNRVKSALKSALKRGFREPLRVSDRSSGFTDRRRPVAAAPRPVRNPEPDYQSKRIIDGIFSQGISILEDPDVEEWLHYREIDSSLVASEGLAVSLPSSGSYSRDHVPWVLFEGEWMPAPVAGIRLLVPFYDAFGERRGGELVRACIEPPLPASKSLALKGARARLVMANPIALGLLRGEDVSPKTVIIVEGGPDFLTASVESPERAIFGIVQGSWKPRHATVIPPDADIIIGTDVDGTGNALAETVAKTLSGRQYGRWRPRGINPNGQAKKDVNDCNGLAGGDVEWKI
jgi:hypothetical protein